MAALDWALPDPRPSDDVPGTLSIVIPDRMYEVGTGTPVAQVHTSTYELFRAVFGRRSFEQIRSWTWSTPSTPTPGAGNSPACRRRPSH